MRRPSPEHPALLAAWAAAMIGISAILGLVGGLDLVGKTTTVHPLRNGWIRSAIIVSAVGAVMLIVSMGSVTWHWWKSRGDESTTSRSVRKGIVNEGDVVSEEDTFAKTLDIGIENKKQGRLRSWRNRYE